MEVEAAKQVCGGRRIRTRSLSLKRTLDPDVALANTTCSESGGHSALRGMQFCCGKSCFLVLCFFTLMTEEIQDNVTFR